MSQYKNITESGVISTRPGYLKGFVVATHSSGTLKLIDGTEPSVAASSVLTSAGACAPAYHAQNVLTSSGAMVAGSHASATLTSGGTNFKDAVAASCALTSDQTNVTAGDTVTIDTKVFTFRAQADMNDPTDVLIGATAAATMLNLLGKIPEVSTVTAALTSTYVITVTAKTPGTGGNSIAIDEGSTHLSWAGAATNLSGGLAAETVTIGTTVYTFSSGVCSEAYQVAIGATLTLSLVNLYNAINGVRPPVGYNQQTSAHASVVAYSSDATTLVIKGRVPGTSLNSLATTETCADAAWGGTTLGGAGNTAGVTTANATVTIGSTVYTVVSALSESLGAVAVAYQVLKGANEAAMIANLAKAINGTGTAGTEYSTGTVAHTAFVCSTSDATTLTIRSRFMGTAAQVAVINALATTETMANTAWAAATCGTGTGDANPAVTSDAATITINGRIYTAVLELSETLNAAAVANEILWTLDEKTFLDNVKKAINASGTAGTDYSTGTTRNLDVVATTNTDTQQTIVSKKLGTIGNAITTTTTLGNYSWTGAVLASGTGATGRVVVGTITFPAVTVGPLTWEFPEEISLDYGLYATVGGTSADITIQYN